jgi:hypothetical protein
MEAATVLIEIFAISRAAQLRSCETPFTQDYHHSLLAPYLDISSICRITSYAGICVSLQSSCLLSRALASLPALIQIPLHHLHLLQPPTTLPDPSSFCSRSRCVRLRVRLATAVLIFRIREVLKLRARISSKRYKLSDKYLTRQPGYLRYKRLPKHG